MSDQISTRINEILGSYSPESSRIQTPVRGFFSMCDGSDYLSSEYMSQEQKAEVLHFFVAVLQPLQRTQIEAFKRQLPTVRVVELLAGHHYCFIRHEDAVAHEIMPFLLPDHFPRPASGQARQPAETLKDHRDLRRTLWAWAKGGEPADMIDGRGWTAQFRCCGGVTTQ